MTSGRWVRVSYYWPTGHHRHKIDPRPTPETMGRREGWARAISLETHGAKVDVGKPIPGEVFQDVEGRWYRVEDTGAPQRLMRAPAEVCVAEEVREEVGGEAEEGVRDDD